MPEPQGLVRQRLISRLEAARIAGLALVVAPAGYGKTTLLAQYASTHPGPVCWHSVEARSAAAGWTGQRLAAAVRRGAAPRNLLLVVDNVDQLVGTSDEAALERLLTHRPRGVHVLLGGRRMPALNLLRHELSGVPGVVGPDELRFRTWEVERLLAIAYGEPLPPDEVALLTRRTGGWAAGLAMFHLSTRGQPLPARRRAVASLSGRWAMARGYLGRTLLAGLDPEVREFLVRSSVFEVLTGARCDRLLETTGSDRVLDGLAHEYGLPVTVDGGNTYQCHQVLRSHLSAALVEDLGEQAAARWHARAARLLVAEGAYPEAARGFARAGDWPAVRELLARAGGEVADHTDQGLDDLLPAWLLAEDPWLVYGQARRAMGHGRIGAALDGFRRAEALFDDEDGKRRCRGYRRIAAIWLADEVPSRTHWSSWLRAAVRRHPAVVGGEAVAVPGAGGELVRLVADLLAGDLRAALRHAADARAGTYVESSPAALGLRLLRTALRLATGAEVAVELDRIADEAESEGVPWLSRMARAARAFGDDPDAADEACAVAAECERRGDRWGHLLALAAACVHDWRFGTPDPAAFARLIRESRELDAGVLLAWAQVLLALAGSAEEQPDAEVEARAAAHLAASAGVPGAHVLATVAIARTDRVRRRALLEEARVQATAVGMPETVMHALEQPGAAQLAGAQLGRTPAQPAPAQPAPAQPAAGRPTVSIRCFGGFRMEIGGRPVDVAAVRARARSALRLLATHAGQVVHKEVLIEALWPDLPVAAATRNLQVTISALRGLIEPASARGKAQLLIRSGDAYGIVLPPGSFCDTTAFLDAVHHWKRVRLSRDPSAELAALRAVVAGYPDELLPEEGPADWAVEARERFRRLAVQAARALSTVELARGNVAEAVAAAEHCLGLDALDDEAWQVLIRAYTVSGAQAKAVEVRRRYSEMLASLGLGQPPAEPLGAGRSGAPAPNAAGDPVAGLRPVSERAAITDPAGQPAPGAAARAAPEPRLVETAARHIVTAGQTPQLRRRPPDAQVASRRRP